MKLTYIHHSGFAIEAEGFSLLFDYFRDTNRRAAGGYVTEQLLRREGPLYVFASHFHPDHFNPEVLRWKAQKRDIRYLFSKDILKRRRAKEPDAIWLKRGDTYSDEHLTVKAFGSTDVGVSFRVEMEGKTLFHAGDLNNWHWKDESTPEEVKEAEGMYLHELSLLAGETPHIDLAMFPVDPRIGSDFMRGAEQFVTRLHPDWLVPMHFWDHPEEIRPFQAFAEAHQCRYILLAQPGESVTFDKSLKQQI